VVQVELRFRITERHVGRGVARVEREDFGSQLAFLRSLGL
jgi:hypothetical protein